MRFKIFRFPYVQMRRLISTFIIYWKQTIVFPFLSWCQIDLNCRSLRHVRFLCFYNPNVGSHCTSLQGWELLSTFTFQIRVHIFLWTQTLHFLWTQIWDHFETSMMHASILIFLVIFSDSESRICLFYLS